MSDGGDREGRWCYTPKELSWLLFNERVLQEAADHSVPIIQRVRYLGIFSSNLDEFFRVRVADVKRLVDFSSGSKKEEHAELLNKIMSRVHESQEAYNKTYQAILKELHKRKIYLVNEMQLTARQSDFVRGYFESKVLPELSPIMVSEKEKFPFLKEGSIYLAVKMLCNKQISYAVLEIPTNRLNRFIPLPSRSKGRERVFITLDNIIRHCLNDVFMGAFPIDTIEAYTIKITRDAELELGEGISESLMEKMSASLKKRSKGAPVRFVYDEAITEDLLAFLTKKMNLRKKDSFIPGGRYHNSKDFMGFPNPGAPYLELKPLPPIPYPVLDKNQNIFECVKKEDCLLYYPYNSFSYIIKWLRAAAIDPAVREIKINLYRVASSSRVVDSLISAVENGKKVIVVVELQARFDEEANITWAERMTEAGVHVIFGVPGLKIHSKMILFKRVEDGIPRLYSHIGTGNFNEKTAGLYTDFSLLTCDQEIGRDVEKVFDFIQFAHRRHEFQHLLVSPFTNRSGLLDLIAIEKKNAIKGRASGVFIKCNNLVDQELIDALYEAGRVGVKVKLIVRGMCSLIPGVKGMSENIKAISIVDRYLEHPRIFAFENAGKPRYYISSADLMTRNLDHRVEVSCPVYSKKLQKKIQLILDTQWSDCVKARVIDERQKNTINPRGNRKKIRSQEHIHKLLRREVKAD
ncbi:MAG: polyphosphate kinase 1 [Cellvibrionales bacterium]|nr:MAG: polyphosphate kinase 1 [Cellvibrionales bacterium]